MPVKPSTRGLRGGVDASRFQIANHKPAPCFSATRDNLEGKRNRVSLVRRPEHCETAGMRGASPATSALRARRLKISDCRAIGIHLDLASAASGDRNRPKRQVGEGYCANWLDNLRTGGALRRLARLSVSRHRDEG